MLEVRGNTLLLGGADIVDGSPVLDIKPYVPFCDGVISAAAPAWVTVGEEREQRYRVRGSTRLGHGKPQFSSPQFVL